MGQYRNRKNGGIVEIDDDKAALFHGEYEPVEGAKPEEQDDPEKEQDDPEKEQDDPEKEQDDPEKEQDDPEKEQDATSPVLKGAALDAALKEAGLSLEGTADEKRARLADASVL